jgi:hypothetical protein
MSWSTARRHDERDLGSYIALEDIQNFTTEV